MSAPQAIHACHDERVLSHVQSENQPNTALTVSELNREAKYLLESHFDWITVEGEIGNFTAASSGHWYFSLKDTDAQVRCAMFRRANGRVKTRPQQGDSVRIRAKVSLYEGRGEFQLICEHLEPAGAGALQLAFEKLKRQLSEEGLFAADSKQPVPHDASHVGVVTSATGAALQDILTVLERRSPHTQVYVFPVAVQGEGAAEQVAAAVTQANQLTKTGAIPLDVLIVGRGGGSLEDLWAFNEEVVARALFASEVPTVSAVGHEVDFSIADLTADVRAPTPSAAAELVSTDQNERFQQLDALTSIMTRSVTRRLTALSQQLTSLNRRVRHPGHALGQQRQTLKRLTDSLHRGIARHISNQRQHSMQMASRLSAQHPRQQLLRTKQHRQLLSHRLSQQMNQQIKAARAELAYKTKLLASLGPEQTLGRGYAIVTDLQGNVLKDALQASKGDSLNVRLGSGSLTTEVTAHPGD
ncbi:MAG: exodeoxyribonuclease VII large subunit [Halieaceae bacterium]|nr:exodeoxyribonuclease VII large subunit [Halieaceae bacterium]